MVIAITNATGITCPCCGSMQIERDAYDDIGYQCEQCLWQPFASRNRNSRAAFLRRGACKVTYEQMKTLNEAYSEYWQRERNAEEDYQRSIRGQLAALWRKIESIEFRSPIGWQRED